MTGRDRLGLAVVVCALVLGGFWFLLLSPKLDQANTASTALQAQQSRLRTAMGTVSAGTAARAAYPANYATVARLGQAVPTDDNVASLVYQISSAANHTDVDFRALSMGGGSSSAPAPPKPPTPGTPNSPASATQAAAAALPPGATVGPAGLPTMPFSFTFTGNFFHLSDFFGRLQRFIVASDKQMRVSGRLLTIDGIGLSASDNGFPQIKASIAATAYLLPPDQGATGGATPSGPAATGSASPQSASAPGASGAPSTPAPAATATTGAR